MLISQTTPDAHPPTPLPCRWPALVTLATLAKFLIAWRRLCDVVLFRSSCRFEHTLTAVRAPPGYQSYRKYHAYSIVVNILTPFLVSNRLIYLFWSQAGDYAANANLTVSPRSLSMSHPPTLSPSRWPALTSLPLVAKFQLIYRPSSEALFSPPSLAGQKPLPLMSRLVWNVGVTKVVMPWSWLLNRSLYLRTQCMRLSRRSHFEHNHLRRAEKAPLITARFTRNRRRTHRPILWGKLGPDRIGAEMFARAPCACRPEERPSTGQRRPLVKP